jgi:hypothetical protein
LTVELIGVRKQKGSAQVPFPDTLHAIFVFKKFQSAKSIIHVSILIIQSILTKIADEYGNDAMKINEKHHRYFIFGKRKKNKSG